MTDDLRHLRVSAPSEWLQNADFVRDRKTFETVLDSIWKRSTAYQRSKACLELGVMLGDGDDPCPDLSMELLKLRGSLNSPDEPDTVAMSSGASPGLLARFLKRGQPPRRLEPWTLHFQQEWCTLDVEAISKYLDSGCVGVPVAPPRKGFHTAIGLGAGFVLGAMLPNLFQDLRKTGLDTARWVE